MAKHTTKRRARKAGKSPPDGFPLWKHPSGRWCKKVRGKAHYFGRIDKDPDGTAALEKWLEVKDDLLAGRSPRSKSKAGPAVADACSGFLEFKEGLRDSGELAPRSFDRYYKSCQLIVDTLGKERPIDDLLPADFQRLREVMTSRWGPVAVANEIQMVRSVFKHAFESGLIDKPVRFGPGFKKPAAKVLRKNRMKNGPRMFERKDLLRALHHAGPSMKAMLLLAINGGLGNTELAFLPISAVDLDAGWLDYPREKTAVPRRVPLWSETVKRIRLALAARPDPKSPADNALLFIGARGQSYAGNRRGYRVHQEAKRVFEKAGVTGRTFYDLRRTFQTVAEGSHDLTAVQAIMGHAAASGDMSAVYRQRIDDDRLRAVVDHVHHWLFPKAPQQDVARGG